ncbi:MAG: phosphogluconate dehydrogenase (NAD(+)-dependent, decarboxylating) [Actinomycetota bacterium]
MEIGFIGLGRMGAAMTRRLVEGSHRVVAFDRSAEATKAVSGFGAQPASSLEKLVDSLAQPRVVWVMVPSGAPTEESITTLRSLLAKGDLVVDGGNSYYKDSLRRHDLLATEGIEFVDAGVSGGVWGYEEGFCIMAGGRPESFARIEPAFKTLAPPDGYAHVGGPGAGHYSKMVHNGIEYGMLESFGEGFDILNASSFNFDLEQLAKLWTKGSVVRSWLLDLLVLALEQDPKLEKIRGFVDDSGEGRWTVADAIDMSVPAPVLTLSLLQRFASRRDESFGDKVIAALRNQFGGHAIHPEERT